MTILKYNIYFSSFSLHKYWRISLLDELIFAVDVNLNALFKVGVLLSPIYYLDFVAVISVCLFQLM